VNQKYLLYLFANKELVDLSNFSESGTRMPRADWNFMSQTIWNIPIDQSEQHAIASVLSSLDDKIDLLNRENQTLEQMAEAIFRQWFIEEADEKWEEVPLSEVFDFKEGPGIRNWQYRDNGIPFINIRLISNGEIDVSKANFVSEAEANAKYKHFYLQRKDMVVSTSGTLGKVAIIRNYHLPLLLNTSVIRFRPKDGINFSFMYGYLRSNEFYECLIDSASGSVQLNFGPIHLKQIVMKIPPNEKLEYFRKVVDPIYEKFELNYNQIRTLEKLRDTLLPKLMSGEVRVKICDA
jgi:type I restriction enzyme S subunit